MKIKNKRIVDSDCNEIKKQFTTTLKSMKQNINKNGNSKKAQKNYYYVIFDYEIMYGMYSTVQYSTNPSHIHHSPACSHRIAALVFITEKYNLTNKYIQYAEKKLKKRVKNI